MSFQPKKKPAPLTVDALYDYAVRALGRRMRTIAELKRLLRTRVEDGDAGDATLVAVITRLEEQNYLNDSTYAATFTRLRQENEKFGKRRVQQDLYKKGVEPELIATTLDTAYEAVNEEQLARKYLERKRLKPPSNDKESARIVRQLIRAGFSTSAVFKVLKSWKVSDDTLAAVETIDVDRE